VRLTSALETLLAERSRQILERSLSAHETDACLKYLALIVRWQRVHRLVGSIEPKWLVENVLLDSLQFLRVLPPAIKSMADLGSGAGLPGIPIKIVRPDLRVTLIESRERRASFLAAAIREIGLQGCDVVAARAEAVPDRGESYDAVVMRCAGDLETLVPVAARLTKPGGSVIASGPPKAALARKGSIQLEWIEVRDTAGTRLFAVYRKPPANPRGPEQAVTAPGS
jgi:16S rRNA (guanine(527)-N(7))-methyltransferase RsmG